MAYAAFTTALKFDLNFSQQQCGVRFLMRYNVVVLLESAKPRADTIK